LQVINKQKKRIWKCWIPADEEVQIVAAEWKPEAEGNGNEERTEAKEHSQLCGTVTLSPNAFFHGVCTPTVRSVAFVCGFLCNPPSAAHHSWDRPGQRASADCGREMENLHIALTSWVAYDE